MNNKIEKFKNAEVFKCNICNEILFFNNSGSLKCQNNHTFDIAAKGYINFVLNRKVDNNYTKDFFINRNEINQQGFYEHILTEVKQIITNTKQSAVLADMGCGEGYYASNLTDICKNIYAFDYSKDAIQFAIRQSNAPFWGVADIGDIPLQNNSIDILLNVFSPANYAEFARILKDDSLLIKVVPAQNHFIEVREAFNIDEYSNENVIEHFKKNFEIIDNINVSKTFTVDSNQLSLLLKMTPVTFNIDLDKVENIDIDKISVAANILIGKKK